MTSAQPDLTVAFKDFAGDFIDSARTKGGLCLYLAMSVLAWNISVRDAKEREEMIAEFIDRFGRQTFRRRGKTFAVRRKVLEMAARKARLFPGVRVVLREVTCRDRQDGLHLEVSRYEPAQGERAN
jgi:hypothetical protein